MYVFSVFFVSEGYISPLSKLRLISGSGSEFGKCSLSFIRSMEGTGIGLDEDGTLAPLLVNYVDSEFSQLRVISYEWPVMCSNQPSVAL